MSGRQNHLPPNPSVTLKDLLQEDKRLRREWEHLEQTAGAEAGPQIAAFLNGQIKPFIHRCIEASEPLVFYRNRLQLLEIIDLWGQIVYNHLDEFTPSSLKPSPLGVTEVDLTWEKLVGSCRYRAERFIRDRQAEGVFASPQDLTEQGVRRNEVRQEIDRFLREDGPLALALSGPAGVGKTFLAGQLAHENLDADPAALLILPYDALDVEWSARQDPKVNADLSDILSDLIARDLGYPDGQKMLDEDEIEYLDKLLDVAHGAHLLLCFDGIERFRLPSGAEPAPAEFLKALNNFVRALTAGRHRPTRIKVLVTCVEPTWSDLPIDRILTRPLFRSATMTEFDDAEFQEAYRKYMGREPEGEEFDRIAEICGRNPYLLRLAADIHREGKEVTREAVLTRFYALRVLRGGDKAAKVAFLARFAQSVDRDLGGVPPERVDLHDPEYAALKMEGIIVQEWDMDRMPPVILNLRPKGLLDFLRERYAPGGPRSQAATA